MSDIDGALSDNVRIVSDIEGMESDMAAEMSDNVKPWTVRGIPPEERNAASEAAKRSDMTLGEWLGRAIRSQIQQEIQASRAPVAVGQVMSDSPTRASDVPAEVSEAMRIAASFRDLAAAGVPISKASANRLCAALLAPLPPSCRRLPSSGLVLANRADSCSD